MGKIRKGRSIRWEKEGERKGKVWLGGWRVKIKEVTLIPAARLDIER
jgi:hypothetical protein